MLRYYGDVMLHNEIHIGLKESELRDFLAKQLAINESHYTIEQAETRLKEAQGIVERTKNYLALQTLLKLKGWQEIDCSDDVADYAEETYVPFVGTYKEFQKIIDVEKE